MTSTERTLEAIATWFPLWDLSKGRRTRVIWLRLDGNWEGQPMTLREALDRLKQGQPGNIAGMLREGILCGDFDQADGLERMRLARQELEREACQCFGGPSGGPGHAHLWVISEGIPIEDITEILHRHGADVRGQAGMKAMRLPETPNRAGVCSTLEGDRLGLQHAIQLRKPRFTDQAWKYPRKDQPGVLNRSAIIQAHTVRCVQAGLGLNLAIRALKEAQPIGFEKISSWEEKRQRRYIRVSIITALRFAKHIRHNVPRKTSTIDIEIARWQQEATAIILREWPSRARSTGIRMVQGIAQKAKRSGKISGLGISSRELADEVGMTFSTAAAHLKRMLELDVLTSPRRNVGAHSRRYALNSQSVNTDHNQDAPAGAWGACPSDCATTLRLEEPDLDCFGGASSRLRVYNAIRQGLRTTKAIRAALGMTGPSVRNHVRHLQGMGLITRMGRTIELGEVSPRECAEAMETLGRTERRRTLHRLQREGFANHLLRLGLGHLAQHTKCRIAPPRTLTPYTVEIETPQEPTERRILVTVGTRRNE
jgi:DNA-binding MarR family transcriptional regulator